MVKRHSSRRTELSSSLLNERLNGAKGYDRIAGYFSSSIIEIAGESIERMEGKVRIVCNSGIDIKDVQTAKLAQNAMRREWCDFKPEELPSPEERFRRLYEFLSTGKMEVKVIPDSRFGLIHGKAGVITLSNDSKTSFLGSSNETKNGWKLNYELIWEDDSDEAVAWVQEEFDTLWNDPCAVNLSQFIVDDIERISKRFVYDSVEEWKVQADSASVVLESPVYRQEFGLWAHQKYFVDLAFREHKKSYGARYVLADQVGLGKTIQLALSAELMALYGDKPILILVPKTLLWQWQEEMKYLLDMPSAVWNGRMWIDENGIEYPNTGLEDIKKCPRKVGIVSQGLIVSNSPITEYLLTQEYECVIVDESHRARRKNLGQGKETQSPEPNNLYDFLLTLSLKTKSMLLATATPIQLYPIELFDLLNILSQKNDSVLGNRYSKWRKRDSANDGLKLITGEKRIEFFDLENWEWIRNPFPPSFENEITFGLIRRNLQMSDDEFVINKTHNELPKTTQNRLGRIIDDGFYENYNPYIRHIVRREREFLENTIDKETGETFLKRIKVNLYGEDDTDALLLSGYLRDAYQCAEAFCDLIKKRAPSGGFLKTLLLKRIGSSIIAGLNTGRKMLSNWNTSLSELKEEDEESERIGEESIKNLTIEEEELLIQFVRILEESQAIDPKYEKLFDLLVAENWMKKGCIVFSQYYDTAFGVGVNLSKDIPSEPIGLYAGGTKSGIFLDGSFTSVEKDELKRMVKNRDLRILIGTDSASEGLNLQTLGTLINVDLPWNPTRLEQRKGRIQRIGQVNDEVEIYNLRYKDSVEDRVHNLLSERLQNIYSVFGQLPDTLEDVWVEVAQNNIEKAKQIIDNVPKQNPFKCKYQNTVDTVDWESCSSVLNQKERRKYLQKGWKEK